MTVKTHELYSSPPYAIRGTMNLDNAIPSPHTNMAELEAFCVEANQSGRLQIVARKDTVSDICAIKIPEITRGTFKQISGRIIRPLMRAAMEVPVQKSGDPENTHIVLSMRAGIAFQAVSEIFYPEASSGQVPQTRSEELVEGEDQPRIVCNFDKLGQIAGKNVIICDPMLATGSSMLAIVSEVARRCPSSITTMSAFTAPQGLATVLGHPAVDYHITPPLEAGLNENFYIVGVDGLMLGDFGDRYCGQPN